MLIRVLFNYNGIINSNILQEKDTIAITYAPDIIMNTKTITWIVRSKRNALTKLVTLKTKIFYFFCTERTCIQVFPDQAHSPVSTCHTRTVLS